MRRSTRATDHPEYTQGADSPLTDDDGAQQQQQLSNAAFPPPPMLKSRKSSGSGPGGGGKKATASGAAEAGGEGKRKRSSSSSTTTSATGITGGGGTITGTGYQAALARSGLKAESLCDVCHDVLVGSHVIIPCRHLLCNDCTWSHLLHLVASSSFAGTVICPVVDCAARATGLGAWPNRDQEVRLRVGNLSTSTYAYRSREIRQAMFERKPSIGSFVKATPLLAHLSYGEIDDSGKPLEAAGGHYRTSSGPQQQQGPSSTPQRPLAVPSHQQRTPASQQQQQMPSAYPTPQTEGRGGGGYALPPPGPPPAARRLGSTGGEQPRSVGGSEKLWVGDLIIPAHGGGEVYVPVEGWTLGLQPHIPSGLLPHPVSLKNFTFVDRTGGLRPNTQALQFRPTTEASATVRIVSEPQLEQIRRAEGLVNQLCETINGRGALGVSIPGVPGARGAPHLIFDSFAVGHNPNGSTKFGLIAMVNPAASDTVARVTGSVPVPLHTQSGSPTNPLLPASSAHQIQDFARHQQQQQMQQQYQAQLSHQMQSDPNTPFRSGPPHLSRGEDPSFQPSSFGHQQQPSPVPVSMPPFRPVPNIALPLVPPILSAIPPHLQVEQQSSSLAGGSQEFLQFESQSPEPSRLMESTTNFDPGEQYYGGPPSMEDPMSDIGVQVEEITGVGQHASEAPTATASKLEQGGRGGDLSMEAGGGSSQTPSWMGSLEVSNQAGGPATRVEEAQGQVQMRSDLMARFDPFLLPPTLSFFASPNFDEQNLELFGRLDISVAPAQHMDIVMACDQAADFHLALLFQMTATDHQATASSTSQPEQKVLLRLKAERDQQAGGEMLSLAADLHLVPAD